MSISPKLGVCYYPEHWPEERWAEDAAQMAALGLAYVRIGEFAWSRIEPREGDFEWSWLDRAIETLGAAGLKVMLGTPTATPPRWMLTKFPDLLACDALGRPRGFGSRRHYCFSHRGYRDASAGIVRRMGERYGQNPHIHSWQIDNEYGCHETVISYSSAAKIAFRNWLTQVYQKNQNQRTKVNEVAALNTAWGNVFWSMEYGDIGEIDLPNLTVTEPNPAHVMDFRRFSSDQVVAFNKAQVDVLRELTDAPLIHNYMGRITEFDHYDVGADLDIASWDSYPMGFLEDRSDGGEDFKHAYQRQGDPDFQSFHHDLYRSVGHGHWGVMEQQPGPVNWAPYNPAPLPGMVRLWSWEAFAHGAEFVNYFRWRQARSGQEQMHAGLLRPDAEPSSAYGEVAQVAQELSAINLKPLPEASIALVFDYASAWAWETQPQGKDFDYFRLVFEMYSALRKLGQSVDIIPPSTADFGTRKLVLIPGLFSWTDTLKAAMKEFQGELIIGPRTGSKTVEFQIPEALPPEIEGMNLKVTAVESLRPTGSIALEGGGALQIWREHVQTSETITALSRDGLPAIVSKGKKHYLCGWPDATALQSILKGRLEAIRLPIEVMPKGVRRHEMDEHIIYTNYGVNSASINGLTLPPTGVRVIEKDTQRIIIDT